MKLHVIFGLRNGNYEGEYAPEVIDAWDEYSALKTNLDATWGSPAGIFLTQEGVVEYSPYFINLVHVFKV